MYNIAALQRCLDFALSLTVTEPDKLITRCIRLGSVHHTLVQSKYYSLDIAEVFFGTAP